MRDAAVPDIFVPTRADGVPRAGVMRVGEVERTTLPEPVDVVVPVPPLSTGSAVPERLTASVPAVEIGEPEMERNDGTVMATLVTVPEPPPPPDSSCHVAADGDVALIT